MNKDKPTYVTSHSVRRKEGGNYGGIRKEQLNNNFESLIAGSQGFGLRY
jgi:hypothetical protein